MTQSTKDTTSENKKQIAQVNGSAAEADSVEPGKEISPAVEEKEGQGAESEAQLISFAGQVTVLRLSGIPILEARIDPPNAAVLRIVPDEHFTGFADQQLGQGDLLKAVRPHVKQAGPVRAHCMMIAQMRVIHAGISAIELATFPGGKQFKQSSYWNVNEDWANGLLQVFCDLLGMDAETLGLLYLFLGEEASDMLGKNWRLFREACRQLRQGDWKSDFGEELQGYPYSEVEEFPVTPAYVDMLWERTKDVDSLDEEEEE